MKNILIVAKLKDKTMSYYFSQRMKEIINIHILLYEEKESIIEKYLKENKFDYIYIRNPFQATLEMPEIRSKLKIVLENTKDAYIIDSIDSVEDIFSEDKWEQYKTFMDFMPETELFHDGVKFSPTKQLLKERISSLGKGIVFSSSDIAEGAEYVIQEKVDIDTEYRVTHFFDKIISEAVIKSSKTEGTAIKAIDIVSVDNELEKYAKKVISKVKFDFIGMDIVRDKSGKLWLLEINRSCFVGGFYLHTKRNLMEEFMLELLVQRG